MMARLKSIVKEEKNRNLVLLSVLLIALLVSVPLRRYYLDEDIRVFKQAYWWIASLVVLMVMMPDVRKLFKKHDQAGKAWRVGLFVLLAAVNFIIIRPVVFTALFWINTLPEGATISRRYFVESQNQQLAEGDESVAIYDFAQDTMNRDRSLMLAAQLAGAQPGDTLQVNFKKGLLGVYHMRDTRVTRY